MTTKRKGDGLCARCGNPRGPGRTRYCGDECWGLAQAERSAERQAKRMVACKRCGGAKELGVRGGKYCQPCRDVMADVSAQIERERSRRGRIAAIQAKIDRGEAIALRHVTYRDGEKWCPRCKQYLPLTSFPKRVDGNRGSHGSYCRPCQKAYNHARLTRITFGITADEYELLLSCQDYRCAICGGKPRKHRLAVDHDHKTGEIRGLLCSRCNHRLLGAANDSVERLQRAIDYLLSYTPREVFGERKFVPGYGEALT